MASEISKIYNRPFSVGGECFVAHGHSCETRGSLCDSCGAGCPNICPMGIVEQIRCLAGRLGDDDMVAHEWSRIIHEAGSAGG